MKNTLSLQENVCERRKYIKICSCSTVVDSAKHDRSLWIVNADKNKLQITLQHSNTNSRVNSINHAPVMPFCSMLRLSPDQHAFSSSLPDAPCQAGLQVSWAPAWVHIWPRKDTRSFSAEKEKKVKHRIAVTEAQVQRRDAKRNMSLQPEEGKAKGDLREGGDRLFLKNHGGRTRGSWHKLEHGKIPLDVRKEFLKIKVVKC